MKKVIFVMFFICLCLAVAVVFPRLSTSEEIVDDTTSCLGCHVNDEPVHDIVVLHDPNHYEPGQCANCHEGGVSEGAVRAAACLACHPLPLVNAAQCDLIEFHEGNPDYMPEGDSCLSMGCHIDDCDEESTTTTTSQASTTTTASGGPCPSNEIYGEGSLEVTLLRGVRDTVLSQTPEGREIIKLYYQWSPVITMAIRNDKAFKAEMKELLDGILSLTIE